MAAISQSVINTIKKNIVTMLAAVSTAEVTAGNPGFDVERDRYRTWDATEDLTAKVNVMLQSMTPEGGGSQQYTLYRASFNVDMYALGGCSSESEVDDEFILTPANIEAADRLDLLIAQVQFGLTQLAKYDLGLTPGTVYKKPGLSLTMSNQSADDSTTVFAPARFTLEVFVPYMASDNGEVFDLGTLTLTMQKALESIQLQYNSGN